MSVMLFSGIDLGYYIRAASEQRPQRGFFKPLRIDRVLREDWHEAEISGSSRSLLPERSKRTDRSPMISALETLA